MFTIRMSSTGMIHSPGMFAYILRALRGPHKKDQKWGREALVALGFCPSVAKLIAGGKFTHKTTKDAKGEESVLLVTVPGDEEKLRAEQRAYTIKINKTEGAAS